MRKQYQVYFDDKIYLPCESNLQMFWCHEFQRHMMRERSTKQKFIYLFISMDVYLAEITFWRFFVMVTIFIFKQGQSRQRIKAESNHKTYDHKIISLWSKEQYKQTLEIQKIVERKNIACLHLPLDDVMLLQNFLV